MIYIQEVGGSRPSTPTTKMELKLKTDVGELTAVFVSDMAGNKVAYTGWIKEYPGVVTQTETIGEGMKQLPKILDMMFEVEIKHLMNGTL